MARVPRYKVFVSYHHENDEQHRNRFERAFADVYGIMDSRSVRKGGIPKGLNTDGVARRIRDDYLRGCVRNPVQAGWSLLSMRWIMAT